MEQGKYDMNSDLTADTKLNLSDLCQELCDEYNKIADKYENAFPNEANSPDGFYKFFKRDEKYGIIGKLCTKLNFDIEAIAETSNQNKFEMLKLLKVLYYIEKYGVFSRLEVNGDCKKVPFIDVLSKPRLSNINTTYSNVSIYGDYFDKFIMLLKPHVNDVENRIHSIAKMESGWGMVLERQYDYVTSNNALYDPDNAKEELNRIDNFLKDKVLYKLSYIKSEQYANIDYSEGVFTTFFNILQLKRMLCYVYDWININYSANFDNKPTDKYYQLFLECENKTYDRTFVAQVEKSLKNEVCDEEVIFVRDFITYLKPVLSDEVKYYEYAFKHLETVLSWLQREKKGFDFSKEIPVGILATIIQEIVHQRKVKDKVADDYVGYNNKSKTLMSALNKKDEAESILIAAWITQLENRFAINYGAHELIEKKREIENYIFEIMRIVFSYNNLADIEKVNEFILHFIKRNLISELYAIDIMDKSIEIVKNHLYGNAQKLRDKKFFVWHHNVWNAFKDLATDPDSDHLIEAVSKDIAKNINSFYDEKPVNNIETLRKTFKTVFSIYRSESLQTDHVIFYW